MLLSFRLSRRGPAVLHEALGEDQDVRGVFVEPRPDSGQVFHRRSQTSQIRQTPLHVFWQGGALPLQQVSILEGDYPHD